MSALDRDKAREVLMDPRAILRLDALLDRLEECVVEPEVVELTVEVEEFSEADMRLARVAALHYIKDFERPSGRIVKRCNVCNVNYPCATRRAIDGGAS